MISRSNRFWLNLGMALGAIALSLSCAIAADPLMSDVQTLVGFGARVAGSPNAERASEFLAQQYRKAGYEVEFQPFSYPKFSDRGSVLTVNQKNFEAWALVRSRSGNLSGKLVAVPNFGRPEDFQAVNVKDAIALIKRGGGLQFVQKINNATKAGAIGVVIINNEPKNIRGMLMEPSTIPAIALSGKEGEPLFQQAKKAELRAGLNVQTHLDAKCRNVIAHLPNVKQPKLIIGGHFDSVENSPGANDNASGTAVVLGLARELAKSPQAQQIWFMAFDGEEDGLKGSDAFVAQADPKFLSNLKGMLNFDMVGVNDQLLIDGSGTWSAIAKSISGDVTSSRFGRSDHVSFGQQNVPTLFFFRGKDPNYHSPGDKVVVPRLLKETQQSALDLIAKLLK